MSAKPASQSHRPTAEIRLETLTCRASPGKKLFTSWNVPAPDFHGIPRRSQTRLHRCRVLDLENSSLCFCCPNLKEFPQTLFPRLFLFSVFYSIKCCMPGHAHSISTLHSRLQSRFSHLKRISKNGTFGKHDAIPWRKWGKWTHSQLGGPNCRRIFEHLSPKLLLNKTKT